MIFLIFNRTFVQPDSTATAHQMNTRGSATAEKYRDVSPSLP